MLAHNPDGEVNAVAKKMSKSLASVRMGETTVATRTVEIDSVNVETGQVIALLDGNLVLSAASVEGAVMGFLEKADAASHELITFYYGEDLNRNEAFRIADVALRSIQRWTSKCRMAVSRTIRF
jgi:dihydroxyacetone kinase-like predicted kinase